MRRRRIRGARDHKQNTLGEIYEWIDHTNAPHCNWCGRRQCFECQAAHQRIRHARAAAERSYDLAMRQQQADAEVAENHQINAAYDQGYQEAARAGVNERNRLQAEINRTQRMLGSGGQGPSQHEIEQARIQGYNAGMNAGRTLASNTSQPTINENQIRQRIMDDVEREMNVVGESNPNMKPAMNALGHLLKKRR